MTLQIQPLRDLGEMSPVVALQQTYWGTRADAVIHEHMLFSIASHGGHVLAATDGDAIAGVVIGLLGMDMAQSDRPAADSLHILSKRMVVSRDYRNYGLGTRLKMAQRAFSLQHGIQRVVWTFDPLLAPNAHLNLRKLGAISTSYRENYYGTNNTGGLSPDGTSDRLYIEWTLDHERVVARVEGSLDLPTLAEMLEGAPVLNTAVHPMQGFPMPGELQQPDGQTALVEIPLDYRGILNDEPELAFQWREHIRSVLGEPLRNGYRAIDFVKGEYEGATRGFYYLSRA